MAGQVLFTLYYNHFRSELKNTKYPLCKEVHTVDDLKGVVAYDHVCALYQDGHRKIANFIQSNCSMFDVDNTESDNSELWTTPDDVRKAFPNVPFYVCYSRNHMKQKKDKAPRPKFHVYFAHSVINNSQEYAQLKQKVCSYFPAFDDNAKDSARFFIGVENPQIEFFDGNVLLSDFMETVKPSVKDVSAKGESNIIPEGRRNATLYQFAVRALVRYGENPAYLMFTKESQKCSPPLDEKELSGIWKSALKFYRGTVLLSPDYVSPAQYNFSVSQNKSPLPIADMYIWQNLKIRVGRDKRWCIEVTRLFLQAFGIHIRINDMNCRIEIDGLPPEYSGEDALSLLVTLIYDSAIMMGYRYVNEKHIYNHLSVIANENRYHPVLECINAQLWDGNDRLAELYRIMGLSDEFHKTLVKKWALQTIAVLYNTQDHPVSAQGVLVLQGEQGIGKTELFRHLAVFDKFFKGGATLDMSNKDSTMSATKVWICELGEIDSTTKKEQSALKAFLTEQTDRYREPYARHETIRPRRTSFCGTVNPKEYLRDVTGNRRFWTIPIEKMDTNAIFSYSSEWYLQFWRQIYQEYQKNPKGHLLTPEEQDRVNCLNANFETDVYGEDEFISLFDTTADLSRWGRRTAAEIADILNKRYKGLNIRSESIGRQLIPRLEKRTGQIFKRSSSNGKRYINCPPLSVSIDDDSDSYSFAPFKSEDFRDFTDEDVIF